MLPSCREVSEQLSENIDKPITGIRWLKLKLHLLMCAYCRRYGHQIKLSSKTINLVQPKVEPDEALKQQAIEKFREIREQSAKDDKATD